MVGVAIGVVFAAKTFLQKTVTKSKDVYGRDVTEDASFSAGDVVNLQDAILDNRTVAAFLWLAARNGDLTKWILTRSSIPHHTPL